MIDKIVIVIPKESPNPGIILFLFIFPKPSLKLTMLPDLSIRKHRIHLKISLMIYCS